MKFNKIFNGKANKYNVKLELDSVAHVKYILDDFINENIKLGNFEAGKIVSIKEAKGKDYLKKAITSWLSYFNEVMSEDFIKPASDFEMTAKTLFERILKTL